jgi:methionyl-tRNA synthetase
MRRRFAALVVLAAAACSAPPENERHQAEGAITAARAAEASTYAPTTLAEAEAALSRYDLAVAQRDYREALRQAVEARDSGYQATREAANEKAIQRGRAERLTAEVTAALDTIRRQPAAAVARQRTLITEAEQVLQETRTIFERQDYRQVVARLEPLLARLQTDRSPLATPAPGQTR